MEPHVLEGTWEEIGAYESRLAGHRVRVTILDPDAAPTAQIEAQFAALAAQWRAETAWTSSLSQMVMRGFGVRGFGVSASLLSPLSKGEMTRPWRLSVGGQTHVSPCRCCSSPSPVAGKTARMISCINVGKLGCAKLLPGAGTRWCLRSGGIGLWCGEVRASAGICQSKGVRHCLILPYA